MLKHVYSPLNDGEVRVLAVLPGDFDDILSCRSETLSLESRETSFTYEALSYCWNEGCQDRRYLLLDDHLFPTTCSLQTTLQYLRRPDRERWIWVDAMCIDQANDLEKAIQVPLMRRIYAEADRVVIWLGKSTQFLSGLFKDWAELEGSKQSGIERIREKVERMKLAPKTKSKDGDAKRSDSDVNSDSKGIATGDDVWEDSDGSHGSTDDSDSSSSSNDDDNSDSPSDTSDSSDSIMSTSKQACLELSFLAWFERVWIVQELCLSKGEPLVMCGAYTLPWTRFYTAAMETVTLTTAYTSNNSDLMSGIDGLKDLRRNLESLDRARQTWQNANASAAPDRHRYSSCTLLNQLCATRGRECSLPVDQVYGILGICTDTGFAGNGKPDVHFTVDYSETLRSVFARTVTHCIATESNLNILGAIAHNDRNSPIYKGGRSGKQSGDDDDDSDDDDEEDIPSSSTWIPDWETTLPPHTFTALGQHAQSVTTKTFATAVHKPPEWRLLDSNTLELKGIKVGRIKAIIRTDDHGFDDFQIRDESSTIQVFKFISVWCKALAKGRKRKSFPGSAKAFWTLLCKDQRIHGIELTDEDVTRIVHWLETAERSQVKAPADYRLKSKIEQVIVSLAKVFETRSVVSMKDGKVGLVPQLAKKGDWIVALLGGETPYVVRAVKKVGYRLAGECFLEGIMDGELWGSNPELESFAVV